MIRRSRSPEPPNRRGQTDRPGRIDRQTAADGLTAQPLTDRQHRSGLPRDARSDDEPYERIADPPPSGVCLPSVNPIGDSIPPPIRSALTMAAVRPKGVTAMNEFQRRREAGTVPPDASGAAAYSTDGRVERSMHDEELDAFRERTIFVPMPRGGILTIGDLQARLAAERE